MMTNAPMASVQTVEPRRIQKNPDNPRVVFREQELQALESSIKEQGILVPLTVYQEGRNFTLLDGERRWRCALRLGLGKVPVIVQAKPNRITNIMMMFAIHNARKDWDPLPTALKLEELEKALGEAKGNPPSERELAAAASISVGEIRRYKKILSLPEDLKSQLMNELEKPRSEQNLTVDHVIEAVSGAQRLRSAGVLDADERDEVVRTIVDKFKSRRLSSTVEPRLLSRIARAVEREEVTAEVVHKEIRRFVERPDVSVQHVFRRTVEDADYRHATEQLVDRVTVRLEEVFDREIAVTSEMRKSLQKLRAVIEKILR